LQRNRYVIVGHCCESGDLLSPAPGEPETIDERELVAADIGDLCVIEGRCVEALAVSLSCSCVLTMLFSVTTAARTARACRRRTTTASRRLLR
jgi:hypothetical protein